MYKIKINTFAVFDTLLAINTEKIILIIFDIIVINIIKKSDMNALITNFFALDFIFLCLSSINSLSFLFKKISSLCISKFELISNFIDSYSFDIYKIFSFKYII